MVPSVSGAKYPAEAVCMAFSGAMDDRGTGRAAAGEVDNKAVAVVITWLFESAGMMDADDDSVEV